MRFLNPLAFATPALGTLGTSQRNSIRGPGSKAVDLSLTRSFRLGDAKAIEVRGEAFNAFNWLNWGQPQIGVNSPTFGQILSVAPGGLGARVIQLAIKYVF
jgi:hypothetical protein